MTSVLLKRLVGTVMLSIAVAAGTSVVAGAVEAAPSPGQHLVVAADGCTAVRVYTNVHGIVYAVENCHGTIRHFRMSPR